MRYIDSIAIKQEKNVKVMTLKDEEDVGFVEVVAGVRDGGQEGDGQHNIDRALLEYKLESSKSVKRSADGAAKKLARWNECRKEKVD